MNWGARGALLGIAAIAAAACESLIGARFDQEARSPDAGTTLESGVEAAPQSDFTIVHEQPGAGSLYGIWGSGQGDVHAVGDSGMILDWDGARWTAASPVAGVTLRGVWGSSPNQVYAVGVVNADGQGIVIRRSESGWKEEARLPTGLVSIWGTDDVVFAGGYDGKLYKQTPTRSWYELVSLAPSPNVPISKYAPIIYGIGGNGIRSIFLAADDVISLGTPPSWTPFYDLSGRRTCSAWGARSADTLVFLGGNFYGIYFIDRGEVRRLNEEQDAPDRTIWGIWGLTSSHLIFVGDLGRIMTFALVNSQWPIVRPSPTARNLRSVWGSSEEDVWIVGDEASILHGRMPK